MYASLNLGVRIKLCKNPFKIHNNTAEELSKVLNVKVNDESNGNGMKSIIPLAEMFEKGFYSIQAINRDLLHKVEYTDDPSKLYPRLLIENGNQFTLLLGNLGKHKNLHWEFQKEWRYILNILPLNMNQPVQTMAQNFQLVANKIKLGKESNRFLIMIYIFQMKRLKKWKLYLAHV